jgi:hypothetical protein
MPAKVVSSRPVYLHAYREKIMAKRVLYNGFTITSAPYPAEFGKWSLKLTITRAHGKNPDRSLEIDENILFDTPEEAYEASVNFGKQIIDGEHDRYSVLEL